jgi:hypothetical protein
LLHFSEIHFGRFVLLLEDSAPNVRCRRSESAQQRVSFRIESLTFEISLIAVRKLENEIYGFGSFSLFLVLVVRIVHKQNLRNVSALVQTRFARHLVSFGNGRKIEQKTRKNVFAKLDRSLKEKKEEKKKRRAPVTHFSLVFPNNLKRGFVVRISSEKLSVYTISKLAKKKEMRKKKKKKKLLLERI